ASLKAGVTSRWSRSQEDIDKFYELTEIMAKRHGITYRPKEYFERLLAAYPEMRIYSTDYEGKTIACMIGLPYNGELWYMYGATA
ncbi:methicillin resistance protein, partial [Gardnerella vaginalis]